MGRGCLQLKVTEYLGIDRWRWLLEDENGSFLADREVRLDSGAFEYRGYIDLPGFLRANRDAYGGDRELFRILGAWMGENVFGKLRETLLGFLGHPAAVHVTIPENASDLLYIPFELAHLEGESSMVSMGVRFVYQPEDRGEQRDKRAGATTDAVRVLAVFSLPRSESPLNLRRERYELKRLMESLAGNRGLALHLRLLQYGATRDTLKKALRESPGWDVIHFSGHGQQGAVYLEDEEGEKDPIEASELTGLLRPAKARLSLMVLSACWSAAESLSSARRQVGLDPPVRDRRQGPGEMASQEDQMAEATVLPSLGRQLSRSLDCAVVGMRYPVGDRFAADLVLQFFEYLLEKGQPVPAALQFALEEALDGDWDNAPVALSPVTPILLGSRAADLALAPPRLEKPEPVQMSGLVGFPPEPLRFIGRLMPMMRAGKAMAPRSRPYKGVLFHGMAGGGKTACLLELAWRHEKNRFAHCVFFKCPDQDQSIATALADFLHVAEDRLHMTPGDLSGHADDPAMFRQRTLPALQAMLSKNSILIAIDNMESLLTGEGNWKDKKWKYLAETLLGHAGESRTIFTSRRVPAPLENHSALLKEAIHALSFPESVLLARELPNLYRLFDDEPERELLRKTMEVVQGHPKLLELADGLASDRARLARQAEKSEEERGRDVSLKCFFDEGESEQSESGFVETLRRWSSSLARTLSPSARLLFWFLCRLEEEDRSRDVIEATWKRFLERVKASVPDAAAVLREPDFGLGPSLKALVDTGLAEVHEERFGENAVAFYAVHPGVAEAAREEAGEEVLEGADAELGNIHLAVLNYGLETETQGGTRLVVLGAERAVPYLMRSRRWVQAGGALEQLIDRAQAPAVLNRAIPLLRVVAKAAEGTNHEAIASGVLAKALKVAGRYEEAKAILQGNVNQCEVRRDYSTALFNASTLFYLLKGTGKLEEALALVERMADFTRRAGMGPWTQLGNECMRLQILNEMGRWEDVLEAVRKHRKRFQTLPEKSDADESVSGWNVREEFLNTGCNAAMSLEQWGTALAMNAEKVESQKARGADKLEMATTFFNHYAPLLRLGRFAEARRLLETYRDVFGLERDYRMLGKTYSAIADLEDKENHREAAVRFGKIALQYGYLSVRPESCAINHNNLSNYLKSAGEPRDAWLAHLLASGIMRIQIGSGGLKINVQNLINSNLPDAPPAFDQIAATVEQIDGVRFREMFALLPARFPDGDAAVAAVWQMVREERERKTHKE